jgi:hypothetical protein
MTRRNKLLYLVPALCASVVDITMTMVTSRKNITKIKRNSWSNNPTMKTWLISIIVLVSVPLFSQTDKIKSYTDRDGVVITIADTTICRSPLTYKFFKDNVYGKLVMPKLDLQAMNCEFVITAIRPNNSNMNFELTIYQKIDYKKQDSKARLLTGLGKSIYMLSVKEIHGDVKLDELIYLYSEI